MKKNPIFISFTCFIIATALFFTGFDNLSSFWGNKIVFESAVGEESAASLSNPYRGFYQMYGYQLSDDWNGTFSNQELSFPSDPTIRLILLQINLAAYRDTMISDIGLSQLQALLEAWSNKGYALILRFLYDWDGHADTKEPDNITIVYHHMNQVSPIINQYQKYIYLLQGVFLGDYGEMHDSPLATGEKETAVYSSLVRFWGAVTDPSIFIAVRTPSQLRAAVDSRLPLTKDEGFSGTLKARLGLFNDGMLGSDTDLGTYASPGSPPLGLTGIGTRGTEMFYQNLLCRYVPNGGEVVIDNALNDLDAAVSSLSKMHVSYLNLLYDKKVLNKWRNSVVTGAGPFQGADGFTYIKEHLGYRYVVRSCQLIQTEPTNSAPADANDVSTNSSYLTDADAVPTNRSYLTDANTISTNRSYQTDADAVSSNSSYLTDADAVSSPQENTVQLLMDVENVGFSPCYRSLSVTLNLRSQETGQFIQIPVDTDTRLWGSQDLVHLQTNLSPSAYASGRYDLYLQLTDPLTGEGITCANVGATSTEGVLLGTCSITP